MLREPLTEREKCLIGAFIHLIGGHVQAFATARRHANASSGERQRAWLEIAEEIQDEWKRMGRTDPLF